MKKKRILTVIAGAALLAGCGGSDAPKAASANEAPAVAVQTLTVSESPLASYYEATGTVRARSAAVLSAKVMGHIREVKAGLGDRVRSGQMLVVLDSRDLEAGYLQAEAARNEARSAMPEVENAIASARANLDLAEVTFKRMSSLFEKKSISNQEFDEARMRVEVARANHQMALAKREQLKSKVAQAEQGVASAAVMKGYAEVKAPFDGVITEKTAEPGSLAAPGQPLMTVERAGGFRLEAAVEESKAALVRPGREVVVALDALGVTVKGRVAEVAPAVDAASRTLLAKIDLPASPGMRSGVFGRARFELEPKRGITVPPEAVIERGQLTSVYVADSGRARARLVTLGENTANRVEVLSGLVPGENVIAPVPPNLSDGAKVEVRQ
ncbi:MAG TPA: efflux RND transporter periplasmic adaptor subunit [Bryobacteraceae bacterium]|nr:efflux RND transporter periplasmic adaptor subunit [Bryobacteraceae bacterium]